MSISKSRSLLHSWRKTLEERVCIYQSLLFTCSRDRALANMVIIQSGQSGSTIRSSSWAPAAAAASRRLAFKVAKAYSIWFTPESIQSRKMKWMRAFFRLEATSAILFKAKIATYRTFSISILSSPLILIKSMLETDRQKIASRRSYIGSCRSIEKIPSLSRIRIYLVSSKSVCKSIALSPLVHLPALTWNLAPTRQLSRVLLPLDQGPMIVTTKSFW